MNRILSFYKTVSLISSNVLKSRLKLISIHIIFTCTLTYYLIDISLCISAFCLKQIIIYTYNINFLYMVQASGLLLNIFKHVEDK